MWNRVPPSSGSSSCQESGRPDSREQGELLEELRSLLATLHSEVEAEDKDEEFHLLANAQRSSYATMVFERLSDAR